MKAVNISPVTLEANADLGLPRLAPGARISVNDMQAARIKAIEPRIKIEADEKPQTRRGGKAK